MKIKTRKKEYASLSVGDSTFLLNVKTDKGPSDKINFNLWKSELEKGAIPIIQMSSPKAFEFMIHLSPNQKFFLQDSAKDIYIKMFNEELNALKELGKEDSDMYFVLKNLVDRIENCETIKEGESVVIGNCKITPVKVFNGLFILLIESPEETVLWADTLTSEECSFTYLSESLRKILKGKQIDEVVFSEKSFLHKMIASSWKIGFNKFAETYKG